MIFKKGDFVIIALVAIVSVVALASNLFLLSGGNTVTVKQNNQTMYTGSLDNDKVLKLEDNTVVIKNGLVYMENAGCKNQLCVNHGTISKSGESIICLPNKVIIEIK